MVYIHIPWNWHLAIPLDIISTTGNCVAASIPLAFAMSLNQKQVENNNLVYLIGTGAGLSIASILLKL